MDHKFDFPDVAERPIVYVRPVPVENLPDIVRAQLPGVDTAYAVHDAAGQQLALVRDRRLAFALARQHDLSPVNAH